MVLMNHVEFDFMRLCSIVDNIFEPLFFLILLGMDLKGFHSNFTRVL